MPDADYSAPTVKLGWQHALSVVKEYKNIDDKLYTFPIKEYDDLFGNIEEFVVLGEYKTEALKGAYDIYLSDIEEFESINFLDTVKLEFKDNIFVLSHISNTYGRTSRYTKIDRLEKMRILMDTSSLEIFINDGEKVISTRFYPDKYERIGFKMKAKLGIKEYKK